VTLDEYLEKAKETPPSLPLSGEEQNKNLPHDKGGHEGGSVKTIYYIVGKSESEVLASPYLAQFKENKEDVLLLTDPIDAWIVKALTEYKGSKLKPITADDIKLKEETKEEVKKKEETKKEYKDFLEFTKNTISADKIEKVELNEKL
jgi:molecular chaperone HtpG